MGLLDARADVFFDVCKKTVAEKLGEAVVLYRSRTGSSLTGTVHVIPGGGAPRCFDAGRFKWVELEDDDIYLTVSHDGTVSVGYSLDDQADCGMSFKVGHPYEVAELCQLITRPSEYLATDEGAPWFECSLGDVFKYYALVPDGKTWRLLDLSALPEGMPKECVEAFYCNLNRDWDNFVSGKTFEAIKFQTHWPEFVQSLPDAKDELRGGYILSPEGDLTSAVDLTVIPPSGKRLFFDLLVVPYKADVSAMYVRELINSDMDINREICKSFRPVGDLETFMATVKATKINLPRNVHTQIRLAAENNAISQWLLHVSVRLATQRGHFHSLAEKHAHLAHTLTLLLDRGKD